MSNRLCACVENMSRFYVMPAAATARAMATLSDSCSDHKQTESRLSVSGSQSHDGEVADSKIFFVSVYLIIVLFFVPGWGSRQFCAKQEHGNSR